MAIMLTRLNTSNEISILPTGLGNHYTANNHLAPPGKPNINYPQRSSIFSKSSVDNNVDDPEAPEANMSFRPQSDYFGPDVLVILGVVLASGGAILTLVSLYCHFRQPAIQATIAGIGPSLIGIGMLFCVLRLFFCSFFTSRTCCECLADGVRYISERFPCFKKIQRRLPGKKRITPAQGKMNAPPQVAKVAKVSMNGEAVQEAKGNHQMLRELEAKATIVGQQVRFTRHGSAGPHSVQMAPVTVARNNGVSRFEHARSGSRQMPSPNEESNLSIGKGKELSENLIAEREDYDEDLDDYHPRQDEEDILKDEIAILDQRLGSANSNRVQNNSINELVLKHSKP